MKSHHDHDHVHGGVLEPTADGMAALRISLGGLAVTAGIQLAILAISGSVALLADTVHNFSDALTAIPLGVAFWIGRRPANMRYTYGYGRSEDLAGIFVVGVVAASAVVALWQAIDRLVHPSHITHLGLVAAAGAIGFVGNEVVAQYRIAVGRRIGSAALEADGYHARADGISSLGVVASAIGVWAGWRDADPVFGLVITAIILYAIRGAARDIYRRLMDAVDPHLVQDVERVLAGTPGIERVDTVRIRWVGHSLHAEAEVTSDADMTLQAAHDVAEEARHRLLHEVRRLTSVTVHTSPCNHHGVDPHARTLHHQEDV